MADATFLPCFAKGSVKRPDIPGRKKIQATYHEAMEGGRFLEKSIGDAIYNLKEAKKDLEEKVKACLRDILTSTDGQMPDTPRAIKFAKNVIDFVQEKLALIDEIASTVAALVQCIQVLAQMIMNMKLMLQGIVNSLANMLAEICNWNLPDLPSIPTLTGLFNFKFPGFNLQASLNSFNTALKFPISFTFPTCKIKLPVLPKLPPVNITIPSGPGQPPLVIDNQVYPTATVTIPNPSGGAAMELPINPALGGPIVTNDLANDPSFKHDFLDTASNMPYYPESFNPLTDILGSVPDPTKLLNQYEMPPEVYMSNLASMVPELREAVLPIGEVLTDARRSGFMELLRRYCNLETLMSLPEGDDRTNKAACWLMMMNNSHTTRHGLWIKEYQAVYTDHITPSIAHIHDTPTPFNSLAAAPKNLPFFGGLTDELLWKMSYLEASLLHWPRSTKWDHNAINGYPLILDFEQTVPAWRDQELTLDSNGLADYPVTLLVYAGYLHQVQDAISAASSDILHNPNWRSSRPQFRFIYDQFGMSTEVDRYSQFWREWKQNFDDLINGEDPVALPYILNYGSTINSRCNPLTTRELYEYLHTDATTRNPNWIPGYDIINLPFQMEQTQGVGEPTVTGWEGGTLDAAAFLARPDIKVLPLTVQHAMLDVNRAYASIMQISAANQAAVDKQMNELKALAGTSIIKGLKVESSKDQPVNLNTKTLLKFDTTLTDIVNVVTAPNLFTIQTPGDYSILGSFTFTPGSIPYERKIEIWVNGAPVSLNVSPKVLDSVTISLHRTIALKTGDTIQVYAYHNGPETNIVKAGFFLSALTDTSTAPSSSGGGTVNSGGVPPGSTGAPGGYTGATANTGNISGQFTWGVAGSGQKIYAAATPITSLTAVYTNSDGKVLPIHPEVNTSDVPFFDGVSLAGAGTNQTVSVALIYGQEYQIATSAAIPPTNSGSITPRTATIISQITNSVPVAVNGTLGVPSPLGNLIVGKMLFVGPNGTLTQDFNYVKASCRWIVAAGRATAKDMFIFEPHVPMDQQSGGGGGPSIGGYTHTQLTASTTWTIHHGLGRYVNVEVYDADGDSVVRDLTFNDLNTCTVKLVVPTTGHAACV